MSPADAVLVGDIGGTNTRLAQVSNNRPHSNHSYNNSQYASLDNCLSDYLDCHNLAASRMAVRLALAAPVDSAEVRLTNLDWLISATSLKQQFGFAEVSLYNDFEAVAMALHSLAPDDVVAIGEGSQHARGSRLVLGPGTGFGAALCLRNGQIVASEAGHSWMPAWDDEEADLLARMRTEDGPPSIEQLLSGQGLRALYRAMDGDTVVDEPPSAEAIFVACMKQTDKTAAAVVSRFFAFLGSAARNLVLATGAWGGVYIAGGIVPRYQDLLLHSTFRERFNAPGPMCKRLNAVPCHLITHHNPALLGLVARHRPENQ